MIETNWDKTEDLTSGQCFIYDKRIMVMCIQIKIDLIILGSHHLLYW